MGKKGDLSNFERCMVFGARRAALSISQSGHLLGFSCKTICMVNHALLPQCRLVVVVQWGGCFLGTL